MWLFSSCVDARLRAWLQSHMVCGQWSELWRAPGQQLAHLAVETPANKHTWPSWHTWKGNGLCSRLKSNPAWNREVVSYCFCFCLVLFFILDKFATMWISAQHSTGRKFSLFNSSENLTLDTIHNEQSLSLPASVPTVCARLCQPINLPYDGTSFLQVVLCYQLHTPLPARKMIFVPTSRTHTHTQTRTRAHTVDTEGTDTCGVFVTSSVDICGGAALWERQPSGAGKAGLEGGKWARRITLLFSVGLRCVRRRVVQLVLSWLSPSAVLNCKYNQSVRMLQWK